MRAWLVMGLVVSAGLGSGGRQRTDVPRGVRLEQHSWVAAERLLGPESVVVIPLGAALKEHGPHLKLRNDLTLAEYFADRVAQAASVVVTPPLTYHFYPAFLDYPGSTSLSLETARDYTVQVVRSLAQHGPRRFYVLNTGISTLRALQPAAETLAQDGILLHYTDLGAAVERSAAKVRQQEGGSHADEIETSMMLYIDPQSVDMSRAVKDLSPASSPMRLRRMPGQAGTYSPTGIWGDPTLATPEKGRIIVEGLLSTMLQDIAGVGTAALPQARPAAAPQTSTAPARREMEPVDTNGCTPGAERTIRRIETSFNVAWRNKDAAAIAALWAEHGDILHPDGFSERGPHTIEQNRTEQFRRREFRASRHVLSFGAVRCINASVAVIDGKWELRDVLDPAGNALPPADGTSTLVVQRMGQQWLIEAYRFHAKQGSPPPPRFLSRPGYPDKR